MKKETFCLNDYEKLISYNFRSKDRVKKNIATTLGIRDPQIITKKRGRKPALILRQRFGNLLAVNLRSVQFYEHIPDIYGKQLIPDEHVYDRMGHLNFPLIRGHAPSWYHCGMDRWTKEGDRCSPNPLPNLSLPIA